MSTSKPCYHRSLGLAILALLGAVQSASGQAAERSNTIPIVQFENVPLVDAIKNLARQANINYIIDPRVEHIGSQGKAITARWENTTARSVLDDVLRTHSVVLVENPVTTVARIAPRSSNVKPVDRSVVSNDTNGVIPLIVMDYVPLNHALQNLARQAGLQAVLDPALNGPSLGPEGRPIPPPMVSIRWEKLTAKQALAALVDNYELIIVENPNSPTVTIKPRK